jgi:hypothetical protein
LQREYFDSVNRKTKKLLREQIDTIEWALVEETLKEQDNGEAIKKLVKYKKNKAKPFFLWRLYFVEVFRGNNPGFDIVIANPPYVRVDDIDSDVREIYKKNYVSAQGKFDLYYLFFELALNISSKNGTFVFISPNKFCASDSGQNLRELLFERSHKISILSTSKLGVFKSAANYPIISVFQKGKGANSFVVREAEKLTWLGLQSSRNSYAISFDDYLKLPNKVVPINTSQPKINLLIKMYSNSKKLGDILSISEGLRIPSKFEENSEMYLPIVKQYQFSKYSKIETGTFIKRENFIKVCTPGSDRYIKIVQEKILIAEDALEISATLDDEKMVPQGGVYFATSSSKLKTKFLLGLINSKLLSTCYGILYEGMHMGGGYLRYRSKFLENLPIPNEMIEINDDEQNSIIAITDQILSTTKSSSNSKDPSKQERVNILEKQIDNLVYSFYKLTVEEMEIMENPGKF